MNLKVIIFWGWSLVFLSPPVLASGNSSFLPTSGSAITTDAVLTGLEKRYSISGFSARFFQASTIKAMGITDVASGILMVKPPGMLRWEYEKPEKQIIVTNGKLLWVYRPEDNQVMIGKFPSFFENGKGAGFLADIKLIRAKFGITLEAEKKKDCYRLKLIPREKKFDLSLIYLSISKKTFEVVKIVTLNSSGDETRIELSNIQFKQNLDDSEFNFIIPAGTDIIRLDE